MSGRAIAIALLFAAVVGLATAYVTPRTIATRPQTLPLTYEPVQITAQQVRMGGQVNSRSQRCNNTDHALEVEATVFWQSLDGKKLIPFTTANGQQVGKIVAVIPEGCAMPSGTVTLPPEITPGVWRLRGSVCWGGITIPVPQTCTQWGSNDFEVLP